MNIHVPEGRPGDRDTGETPADGWTVGEAAEPLVMNEAENWGEALVEDGTPGSPTPPRSRVARHFKRGG
jgi:hypothetical protein